MEPAAKLLADGRAAAPPAIRPTAYLRREGAASEGDVKRRARAERRITWHAQVGSTDWPATAAVLRAIEDGLAEHGHRCDRYGLTLSRAMSVPAGERDRVAKETGPIIDADDWAELGTVAAIQPHLGDFMIGAPTGFEHALLALANGVTTIGNVGQYMSFDLPGGQDDEAVTEAAVRTVGALAAWRDRGALVHSYLDDGVAMQATHYGAYVGWAALERYAIEDLCGARLAHCYGGLIHVPAHRAIVHLALDDIHDRDHLGSMIYGNTVDMRAHDRTHNTAVLATYLLVDIAAQLRRPTGAAIHAVPLTEAERVPSAAENVEVQLLGRALEAEVRRSGDLFDWPALERTAGEVAAYARTFRDRVLARLAADGTDIRDAAAVLLALRRTGMAGAERLADLPPPPAVGRLEPWKAGLVSGVVERLGRTLPALAGRRIVLAVLDVHDVVRDSLARALPRAGAEVVLLPSSVTPAGVAAAAVAEDADAIVLGTYNGAALTIGRALRAAIDETGYEGRVIVGGRLNEDLGGELPVDVTDELRALGFAPAAAIEDAAALLA